MGVEIEIFLDSHIFSSLPLLTCKLCNKILSLENVELPCGHVYCRSCLQSCIQLTRVESCPICNFSFQSNQNLKESLVAKNILSPLLTQCQSCPWNGPYLHFSSHSCSPNQQQQQYQQQGNFYSRDQNVSNNQSQSSNRITSSIQTPFSNHNLNDNSNNQQNIYTTPPQYYQPPSYRPPSYTEEDYYHNLNQQNNNQNNHRTSGLRSASTPVLHHNNNNNNFSDNNLYNSNNSNNSSNNIHSSGGGGGGGSSMFNSVLNNNRSSKQYSVPVLSPHDQYSSDFKRLCDNCGGKSATKIGEDGLCGYCRLYG